MNDTKKPEKWVWLTVSWFGVSGLFKGMRGTWGTLAALPFAYAIQMLAGNNALFIASIIVFAVGCIASQKYMDATGKDDPNEVVVDEVAGIFLLLAFMPMTWQSYLIGFFVFRVFDVLKPWPVSWADKNIKGGFGVMFDDILAALYPLGIYYLYVHVIL